MTVCQLKRTLRSSLTKNGPEIQAFLTGNMPSFVTRSAPEAADRVPVIFFHGVEPAAFEAQLRYLRAEPLSHPRCRRARGQAAAPARVTSGRSP